MQFVIRELNAKGDLEQIDVDLSFLQQRPRMHFKDVRSPSSEEWAYWSLMPQLQLWQAVALLCNIEPSSLPVSAAWRLAEPGTPGADFASRFDIALAHHLAGELKCTGSMHGFDTDFQVRCQDFAEWVDRVDWQLPHALAKPWRRLQASTQTPVVTSPGPALTPDAEAATHQDRVRRLEAAEAQRRQSMRKKAQQASAVRWSALEQHKLRAMELANSQPFTSRVKAAEFARDRIEKKAGSGEMYSIQTVDDWLREGGWKKSSG